MLNIDLTAVGNWAERHNVSYASYQELAGLPAVGDMLQKHVEDVNAILAGEPRMAGAQIKRFLILHKELDADDGELTRTQKVRRSFIAERYAPLVTALYDGTIEKDISTQVTFEDGRTGVISARLKIRDVKTFPARRNGAARNKRPRSARHEPVRTRRAGASQETLLAVENVSLSFGGVKAITDVSFDIKRGEIRAIIGPNGAGKTSMLNVINGFYHPQLGRIAFKGQTRSRMKPHEAARQGIARTFQNVALFKGMTTLDNIMVGRSLQHETRLFLANPARRAGDDARRSSTENSAKRSSTSWRSSTSARRRSASCPTACKSASNLAGRWRWSPTCCCSTSRWPA